MKSKKQVTGKRFGAVLTAMVLCFSVFFGSQTAVTALAADTGSINLNEKGNITVTLSSNDGEETVSDGTLAIYKVANLELPDWNMSYVYTDDFSELGEVPEDIESLESAEYALVLAQWAVDNSLAGTEAEINANGTVIFDGLTAGLYLIIQTEASEGYYSIDPFVVTLPTESADGIWVYEIDASPKTQIYPEDTGVPENEDETPGEGETPGEEVTGVEPGTDEGSTLPQTGQLYWPIPILVVCGAALIGAGLLLRRKKTYAS